MGRLVDLGLVAQDGDSRHRLLETVKLFARQRWAGTADADRYLQQHTQWVLDQFCRRPRADWFTSYVLAGWVDAHYEDIRAVEDRLVTEGRLVELADLLAGQTLSYTFATGSRAAAMIERVERYLQALPLDDHQTGVALLVASCAGLPARRPDWMDQASTGAVEALRRGASSEALAAALIVQSWMTVLSSHDAAIALLDEAELTATASDSPAIANVALAYRVYHLALVGDFDSARQLREELSQRLDPRTYDYAADAAAETHILTHVVDEPEVAEQTWRERLPKVDRHGGWAQWSVYHLQGALVAAGTASPSLTLRRLAECDDAARDIAADDGLPDLLVPLALIAYKIGDINQAQQLLTAIRHAPRPTQNYTMTTVYRQLRDRLGLLDHNPLDGADIQDVYQQATIWLAGLEPR